MTCGPRTQRDPKEGANHMASFMPKLRLPGAMQPAVSNRVGLATVVVEGRGQEMVSVLCGGEVEAAASGGWGEGASC